jgi:thiol-disulfide isomerase/thioredoxin
MNTRAYAILQLLLSATYGVFRLFPPAGTDAAKLASYEFTCLVGIGVTLAVRLIRVDSWLGYFVFALKAAHLGMAALLFAFSARWGACFALAAVLCHFGVDPPFLEVSHRVATLGDAHLRAYIARVPACLVLFYAPWEGRCIAATPVFAALAERYTAESLLFARCDVGRSRRMAEEFRVSATNGTLNQIPTIIHFRAGAEVRRLSPAVSPGTLFNLPSIVKYFRLAPPG